LFRNEDEDKTKANQFLEKNQYNIPIYSRAGDVPTEIFGGTLSTTIVISKQGKIVLKHEKLAGYKTDEFIRQLSGLS
jgi:hypothetical protein